MAVTKKDVFTAIESLEQQGITATNAAILEITGGAMRLCRSTARNTMTAAKPKP
jgi:hypothetical protein